MTAGSTFGADSTADDVLAGHDLRGQRVVITGASAGIGLETARSLAAHGAPVVMVVRDREKGERAAEAVRATAAAPVELREMDLASLASVRACADALLAEGAPIALLIANAGVMACPQATTADGFETQFGTNHLGHFVFVNKLAPLVLAAAPSRIIVLTSSGHRFSDIDLDDPNFEHTPYDPWAAYGRSKSANALFASELDRRLGARGVRAVGVHPGGVTTELGRHLTRESILMLQERNPTMDRGAFKAPPQGAATTVWAAVAAPADEVGGRYCEDCAVSPLRDEWAQPGVLRRALDPARAAALWTASEAMVGERFPLD